MQHMRLQVFRVMQVSSSTSMAVLMRMVYRMRDQLAVMGDLHRVCDLHEGWVQVSVRVDTWGNIHD